MTKAEQFIENMVQFLAKEAETLDAEVELEEGIIKITFDDGTYADFTEPLAFDEDDNQLSEPTDDFVG